MFCLDSNIAIALLRGVSRNAEERLANAIKQGVGLALPSIVLMELRFGVYRAQNTEKAAQVLDRFLLAPFEILPFAQDDADCAAQIRTDLARKGLSIGPFDVLIAAQAMVRDVVLVTNNTREFSRIPGLKVEDWLTP